MTMRTWRGAASWMLMLTWLPPATARATPGEREAPELHVSLMACEGLPNGLLAAVRDEVDGIYQVAGFRIVWLDEPPNPAKPYEARAYIIEKLPPSLQSLMKSSQGRAPMAITLGSNPNAPGPDIYLSLEAVLSRAGHRRALAFKHMGRALSRALAHELAHRFLRSGHTEHGMLRPVLTGRDLIDGDASDLFLTAEQIRELEATAMTPTPYATVEGDHSPAVPSTLGDGQEDSSEPRP